MAGVSCVPTSSQRAVCFPSTPALPSTWEMHWNPSGGCAVWPVRGGSRKPCRHARRTLSRGAPHRSSDDAPMMPTPKLTSRALLRKLGGCQGGCHIHRSVREASSIVRWRHHRKTPCDRSLHAEDATTHAACEADCGGAAADSRRHRGGTYGATPTAGRAMRLPVRLHTCKQHAADPVPRSAGGTHVWGGHAPADAERCVGARSSQIWDARAWW